MQSRIKFEYLPNGNLQRTEFLDDKIYTGSVATTEYMLKMADPESAENWLPTDLVYINFKRPDNVESSVAMVWRSDLGLWLCTTNGAEANYNVDELTYLQISFTCKRGLPLTPSTYSTRTSETSSVAVYPSGAFIPENIEESVAIDLQNQINALGADITDLNAEVDGKADKATTIAGVDLQNDITAAELKTALSINNVDNTSDMGKPVSTAQQAAINTAKSEILSSKEQPNGIATLDEGGKIPSGQLPSYVDDVIEVATFAALPSVGESGKIYVTLDTNLTYRWSGSGYVEISKSLALGETSTTAYRGDRGKELYDFTSPAFESGQDLQSKLDLKADKSELVQPWSNVMVTANAFTADATANLNYILTNSQDVALTIINAYNGSHFLIEAHGGALTLPPDCETDAAFDYVTADEGEYCQYEFVYNGTVWRVTRNVYKTA